MRLRVWLQAKRAPQGQRISHSCSRMALCPTAEPVYLRKPHPMPRSKDETRRRFREEPEARAFLLERLSGDFDFWEKVRAIGAAGDIFELDAVSKCEWTGHVTMQNGERIQVRWASVDTFRLIQ